MLILVRDNETSVALDERCRAQADAIATLAAAPVQYVPASFLLTVEGLFPEGGSRGDRPPYAAA